jgi:uncharacterized protein (UPF0332 family)
LVNHPDIAILIQNAHDRVNAAEVLYESEYYAMFYAARALLLSEEIIPRTHKGVISSISDRFVKTGLFAGEYNRRLWIRQSNRKGKIVYSSLRNIAL